MSKSVKLKVNFLLIFLMFCVYDINISNHVIAQMPQLILDKNTYLKYSPFEVTEHVKQETKKI